MRDDDVRSSCFASLDVLCAKFGADVPYRDGLDAGFPFRGSRVPFLSHMKGIYRARAQRGLAALSINTSSNSPYGDRETDEGVLYAYRTGSADDPVARTVLVTKGAMTGPFDEREPVLSEDPIERRYAVREMRVRVHQSRFRGRVIPAYKSQCTICRLKEERLLDAAHIVSDADVLGEPEITNGLSLCAIHHRAFDQNLVAITPDYGVAVAERLLEDEDGPMLDLLKGFHGSPIHLPERRTWRPDREHLARRYDEFVRGGA